MSIPLFDKIHDFDLIFHWFFSEVNKEENLSSPLVAKEHFVFTDPEGQLYHFSVEGNAIKDGTKIPAETSLCKFFSVNFYSKLFLY